MSRIPYSMMPNLGDLQEGDIVPCLRPPYSEGTAFVSDIQKYVRPYDIYVALLTQSGTDAPTANILENTIGEITYGYEDDGNYNIFSDGLFTEKKTTITIGTQNNSGYNITFITGYNNVNQLSFLCFNGGTPSNGVINNIFLEIRVYYSEPA